MSKKVTIEKLTKIPSISLDNMEWRYSVIEIFDHITEIVINQEVTVYIDSVNQELFQKRSNDERIVIAENCLVIWKEQGNEDILVLTQPPVNLRNIEKGVKGGEVKFNFYKLKY